MNHDGPQPTYEIVDELSRFDERDTVFSRERLEPGSPQEQAYHSLHPELVEIDRRIATFIRQVGQPGDGITQEDAALFNATFDPIAGLALPDVVDGEVAPTQVQADPARMSARIKALARYLGADDVRIGPLNPAWVYSHRGTPPFFAGYQPNPPHYSGLPKTYRDLQWGDPIEIPHRYAIAMAFAQDLNLIRTGGTPFSDLEIGRVYAFSALVATQIATYIRSLGWPARAHHMRNYGVLVVPVAVDAGLGELGRCGYLIHPRLGANLRLVCVTTDLPLQLDPPVDLGIQDFCNKCLKCAHNCPSGAIPKGDKVVVRGVRKWQIDPVKCLLYWGHLRSACAICQSICPWSKPLTWPHRLVAQIAMHVPPARRFLIWADDVVYGARFKPAPPPAWSRQDQIQI
ncbi:MAG: reductive dehalogenase [Anaerolineae bacterium]|nr:reductive dehalogenase [Anaerolineae bacterium]